MFLMGCELVILIMSNCLCLHIPRDVMLLIILSRLTSPPINLYHKQYMFTSLLKVAPYLLLLEECKTLWGEPLRAAMNLRLTA